MNRSHLAVLAALPLMLAVFACDKKDEGGTAPKSSSGGASAPAKPAAAATMEFKPVKKLGVQIKIPSNATVEDGAGDGVMIMASNPECTILLSKVGDMSEDYDHTIASIEKGYAGGKPKSWGKKDKTANGWTITYTSTDDIDKKDKFGVNMRVKVDGKDFDCSRVTDTAAAATCIEQACASLKKL